MSHGGVLWKLISQVESAKGAKQGTQAGTKYRNYFLLACQAANTSASRSGFSPARIFVCRSRGCFLNHSSVAAVVSASERNVSPLLTALLIFTCRITSFRPVCAKSEIGNLVDDLFAREKDIVPR